MAADASALDIGSEVAWYQGGGYRDRFHTGIKGPVSLRALLEHVVRRPRHGAALAGRRDMGPPTGMHGGRPPSDEAGFLAFARALPTPEIADLREAAIAAGAIVAHRLRSNQRRHVERCAGYRAGW